jgi:hypothetical protein
VSKELDWLTEERVRNTRIPIHIKALRLIGLRFTPAKTILGPLGEPRFAKPSTTSDAAAGAISSLGPYATKHARAKIIVFPAAQIPLAREIASLFGRAGWNTDLNEMPQEPSHHRYVSGVEIRGFTSHRVHVVAEALIQGGIPGVRETVEECQIAKDNPKYPFAIESIRVTVGHV